MPTALIQPPQFGSQATQLNFIGNLRSSRVVAGMRRTAERSDDAGQRDAQERRRRAAPSREI